ncbi:MAG: histidine triad nucleotide-binding protein [Chloroflexi bacterium]|nr:histidine triad nucleotide-binding protein [Chloroflexota bacterium]
MPSENRDAPVAARVQCPFCEIVAGRLPAAVVYEDDDVLAFRDIAPRAPVHVLVIPRRHLVSVMDLRDEEALLLARIFSAIREVARREGVAERGFRVVSNAGRDGGQTVGHLHLHVLGGRFMTWPPG